LDKIEKDVKEICVQNALQFAKVFICNLK